MRKTVSSTTKICAMCEYWNGNIGGKEVIPKRNMPNFFEFESREKKTCFITHFEKEAWHTCGKWKKRY